MRRAAGHAVVLVTAPSVRVGRMLAAAALEARVAACANLVPGLESHYRWKGKIECSREVLILFKTTRGRLAALERLILAKHPYDTPEFLAFVPSSGAGRYLDWLEESVGQSMRRGITA